MNISNLFFHIHYCNFRRFKDTRTYSKRIARTLDHHELILVIGGRGSVMVDHKKHPFRAGMLFYIRPGVFHSIEFDLEDPIYFLAVHFSYAQVQLMEGQWSLGEQPETLPLHTAQDLKDYYQIEESFSRLVEGWNAKLPGYEFAAKTTLQQLLIAIYQNNKRSHQNFSTSLKVEKLIGYMQEHVCTTVTLPELAGLVQLRIAASGRQAAPYTADQVIGNAVKLVDAFTQKGAFVVLVRVSSLDGRDMVRAVTDSVAAPVNYPEGWDQIVPDLAGFKNTYTVTKRQWGAFFGTDLDLQLRRRGIQSLVLCGISTSIGVDTTAREAYQLGYQQVFAEDAMTASTREEHDYVCRTIFPRIGRIRTSEEIAAGLK